jgi:hypothetical protein
MMNWKGFGRKWTWNFLGGTEEKHKKHQSD